MSMTFTKLFSSITESTIWLEPNPTRIVWIAMLAMADKRGRVWGSVPGIANRARVTTDEARQAIACFLAPDPDSRTKEHEGRRIVEIDGGWQLLNYTKYREMRDDDARREYMRDYMANKRKKLTPVSRVSKSKPPLAQAEAEAEADADIGSTNVDPLVWAEFVEHRKAIRKPLGKLSAQKNLNILSAMTPADQRRAVDATIANNWTGIFPPKGNANGADNRHSGPLSAVDRVRAAAATRAASDPNY